MNKYQKAFEDVTACNCRDCTCDEVKLIEELIERATAKKLYYEGDGYWDGQLIYDTAICPCCGRRFEVDYDEHSEYCPSCGQALDWRDEK